MVIEMMTRPTDGMSDRVARLKHYILHTTPQVGTQRVRFLLEAYKEHEGQPTPLIRAKLLEKFLCGMDIFIDENPIVGNSTEYRCGVAPIPEWSCRWMKKQIENDIKSRGQTGEIATAEADKELIFEAVDYWGDRCVNSRTQEILKEYYGDEVNHRLLEKIGVWSSHSQATSLGQLTMDYAKVLNKGLNGVIAEIEEELEKLKPVLNDPEALRKRHFLRAMHISLEAAIKFAHRYAELARKMAQEESDPERKSELEEIALICDWVPANPARTFREAIQSFWFIHVVANAEQQPSSIVPGRFAMYMYPFYAKDKAEGRITDDEEVIELLQCLYVKLLELGTWMVADMMAFVQGLMNQNITLGGLNPDGTDATTQMDFLVLEAQRRFKGVQPTLSVMYHDKLSDEFLVKCAQVIRDTGSGQPSFFNNDIAIQRLLYHHPGITLEEARNINIQGCVHTVVSHATDNIWEGHYNNPKMLELALNNGTDPVSGHKVGPETGDAESFETYEELREAVRKQIAYFMPLLRQSFALSLNLNSEIVPLTFASALVDDCIKTGREVNSGGSRYDKDGVGPIGMIDLANSLATIKKLVFEDKSLTIAQLKEALRANFEGYEDIHKMCLDAPKYGNDDDYVDQIVRDFYDIWWEEHQKSPDHLGKSSRPEAYSVASHFHFGKLTGALPSGREAGISLCDATVSAMPGTDVKGPTALVRSAVKALDTVKYGSNHFNMKFHPTALATTDSLRKLISLIKTYMDLGGSHIQFNCVSRETLVDAQNNPEKYRDLVVRVAGFSAFFIHLDKGVQDEIIKRTELTFT